MQNQNMLLQVCFYYFLIQVSSKSMPQHNVMKVRYSLKTP